MPTLILPELFQRRHGPLVGAGAGKSQDRDEEDEHDAPWGRGRAEGIGSCGRGDGQIRWEALSLILCQSRIGGAIRLPVRNQTAYTQF